MSRSNYDRHPRVPVPYPADAVTVGWAAIVEALASGGVVVVECYPGAPVDAAFAAWRVHAPGTRVIDTRTLFRTCAAIAADLAATLTEDRVFGRLDPIGIELFFDPSSVAAVRENLGGAPTAVIGPGAAHVAENWSRLAHVGVARWELQARQRRGEIGSLGADDSGASAAALYKRAFFVDWRVGDRVKRALLPRIDAVVDANANEPRMIAGEVWRAALAHAARRPFRLVPFFDPGPWGGTMDAPHARPAGRAAQLRVVF